MNDSLLNKLVKKFTASVYSIIFLCNVVGCGSVSKTTGNPDKKNISETKLKIKLKGGETHLYSINLNAGEFVHIKATQYGIDVMAKVTKANGEGENIFDSPTGELGEEDIYLEGTPAGSKYQIEIYPAQKYADQGEYVISIVRLDKESETDKKWMAALASTQKADKLRARSDTRLESVQQYELAAAEWMALKDTVQYASTMRSLGFGLIRLKNYEKAVNIFSQLLPIWNQVRDIRSEGFTYLIIGRIYDLQKKYKQALDENLNSLEYWIKSKDVDQESFTLMNVGDLYIQLSDKQKAINSFEQALKKNESSERPSIKAVILRDYATAMLSIGENEHAVQLYEQSLKQWKLTINTPEEARTAFLLAAYYDEKKNRKEAIQFYCNALGIWQKLGEQTEINKIQALLEKLGK